MTENKQYKKFEHPLITAKGEQRAIVPFLGLETLWFNTGTLCNLACSNCYIESSPKNDQLSFISLCDVTPYLNEIKTLKLPVHTIGFTGGEPFINPHFFEILKYLTSYPYNILILTNAYQLSEKIKKQLLELKKDLKEKLILRVSFDHYTQEIHEKERGLGTFNKTISHFKWLVENGFKPHIASRSLLKETFEESVLGHIEMLKKNYIYYQLDSTNLVIFPELNDEDNVPEITEKCWDILKVSPKHQMCATHRMIVKRKENNLPQVVACTLIAHEDEFTYSHQLKDSMNSVRLNHPYCAKFCVLGKASCTG